MVKWDSHTFEDIIAKLFEKNGYAVIAKNQHEDGGVCQEFCVNRFNKQHRIAA